MDQGLLYEGAMYVLDTQEWSKRKPVCINEMINPQRCREKFRFINFNLGAILVSYKGEILAVFFNNVEFFIERKYSIQCSAGEGGCNSYSFSKIDILSKRFVLAYKNHQKNVIRVLELNSYLDSNARCDLSDSESYICELLVCDKDSISVSKYISWILFHKDNYAYDFELNSVETGFLLDEDRAEGTFIVYETTD